MRCIHLDDLEVAAVFATLRTDHVVLDATARREIVLGERGGIARRAPPALELARIGPQLPHALSRRVELSFNCHRERLWILADGGNGQCSSSFVSEMSSAIR